MTHQWVNTSSRKSTVLCMTEVIVGVERGKDILVWLEEKKDILVGWIKFIFLFIKQQGRNLQLCLELISNFPDKIPSSLLWSIFVICQVLGSNHFCSNTISSKMGISQKVSDSRNSETINQWNDESLKTYNTYNNQQKHRKK